MDPYVLAQIEILINSNQTYDLVIDESQIYGTRIFLNKNFEKTEDIKKIPGVSNLKLNDSLQILSKKHNYKIDGEWLVGNIESSKEFYFKGDQKIYILQRSTNYFRIIYLTQSANNELLKIFNEKVKCNFCKESFNIEVHKNSIKYDKYMNSKSQCKKCEIKLKEKPIHTKCYKSCSNCEGYLCKDCSIPDCEKCGKMYCSKCSCLTNHTNCCKLYCRNTYTDCPNCYKNCFSCDNKFQVIYKMSFNCSFCNICDNYFCGKDNCILEFNETLKIVKCKNCKPITCQICNSENDLSVYKTCNNCQKKYLCEDCIKPSSKLVDGVYYNVLGCLNCIQPAPLYVLKN